jgi:single-stranded DNA-binding protein
MTLYNSWTFVGRATGDPKQRDENASFCVALNSKDRTGAETTMFVDVICFRFTASKVLRDLRKGALCLVTGSLKTTEFMSGGEKRTGLNVAASTVVLLSQPPARVAMPDFGDL